MEKKLRSNQSSYKGLVTDSRKYQDNSSNVWSRNAKRRELPNVANNKSDSNRNKQTTSNSKFRNNYDKRYATRNDGYQRNFGTSEISASGTGLEDDDAHFEVELNSIYTPGSKKQNLNHLLNFSYAPIERGDPSLFMRSNYNKHITRKNKYNKEQFLQATCKFVVRCDQDYTSYTLCPDKLIDWQFIEQIYVHSPEEPQCPICLYYPVAGKMTKCGHVYCFPCILHYLALSDKEWRKCPICYEPIYTKDLKSALSVLHQSYNCGDYVTLQLMCREKGSLYVRKATQPNNKHLFPHLSDNDEDIKYSKIILADSQEILTIIERERKELNYQLSFDEPDCPESIFLQNSLTLLDQRKQDILNSFKDNIFVAKLEGQASMEDTITQLKQININEPDDKQFDITDLENTALEGHNSKIDFIINEDTTFDDINITPLANDSKYYFYQSVDGQHLYLHSINVRMLQTMYGSLERAPHLLNCKVLQKQSCSMSDVLRKRLKYLQHLPETCQFEVVEIELKAPIICDEVLKKFQGELSQRQKSRKKKERDEHQREKHINKVNEQQMGKLFSSSSPIDLDMSSNHHFPSCSAMVLPSLSTTTAVRDGVAPVACNSNSISMSKSPSGISFAEILTKSSTSEKNLWPSLEQATKITQHNNNNVLDNLAAATASGGAKKKKFKNTISLTTGGRCFTGN